jgi:hypothetical protein
VIARLAVLTAFVAGVAGCGGDDESAATPTPTKTPSITAMTSPAPQDAGPPPAPTSGANAFIGSIAIDPGDGTVMLGTGLGLFRLEKGAKDAKRVSGTLRTPSGVGLVSSNLVVRYSGPGELLGSGHPEGGSLPENLGLMSSRNAGNTWAPVVELGKTDYHILQAAGRHIVGVLADDRRIRVSGDGGRSFEDKTPPDVPLDVAFDPGKPEQMVVATQQGVFTSADGGGSWRERDTTPAEQLAWGESDTVYRADPGGAIKVSGDAGTSWDDAGTVGMQVNELAVDAAGAVYASVAGGEVRRSTDGGRTWSRLVKLR